ncbi:FG-GAP repeat domain-containing protein [Gemmatimonadota bacterium]
MDLSGDGIPDILSGAGDAIYLFDGRADGTFKGMRIVLSPNIGSPGIDSMYDPFETEREFGVDAFYIVTAADWDRDGDLDLIVGDRTGHLFFYANGGGGDIDYELPQRIELDGEPILAFHGYAAPYVHDWDGDGNHDLLLGSGSGSVEFFRNTSDSGLPVLVEPVELVKQSGATMVDRSDYDPELDRGGHSVVCVADWNADGLDDLIVGTHRALKPEEIDLTLPQEAMLDRYWTEFDLVREKWFQERGKLYRKVLRQEKLTAEELAQLPKRDWWAFWIVFNREVSERPRLVRLLEEFQARAEKIMEYWPKRPTHGWVWVYLREGS